MHAAISIPIPILLIMALGSAAAVGDEHGTAIVKDNAHNPRAVPAALPAPVAPSRSVVPGTIHRSIVETN